MLTWYQNWFSSWLYVILWPVDDRSKNDKCLNQVTDLLQVRRGNEGSGTLGSCFFLPLALYPNIDTIEHVKNSFSTELIHFLLLLILLLLLLMLLVLLCAVVGGGGENSYHFCNTKWKLAFVTDLFSLSPDKSYMYSSSSWKRPKIATVSLRAGVHILSMDKSF